MRSEEKPGAAHNPEKIDGMNNDQETFRVRSHTDVPLIQLIERRRSTDMSHFMVHFDNSTRRIQIAASESIERLRELAAQAQGVAASPLENPENVSIEGMMKMLLNDHAQKIQIAVMRVREQLRRDLLDHLRKLFSLQRDQAGPSNENLGEVLVRDELFREAEKLVQTASGEVLMNGLRDIIFEAINKAKEKMKHKMNHTLEMRAQRMKEEEQERSRRQIYRSMKQQHDEKQKFLSSLQESTGDAERKRRREREILAEKVSKLESQLDLWKQDAKGKELLAKRLLSMLSSPKQSPPRVGKKTSQHRTVIEVPRTELQKLGIPDPEDRHKKRGETMFYRTHSSPMDQKASKASPMKASRSAKPAQFTREEELALFELRRLRGN